MLNINRSIILAALTLCLITSASNAADWPAYMHDNSRSGLTAEAPIIVDLEPGWVLKAPAPPQVAWDGGMPWDAWRSSSEDYSTFNTTPMRDFDFVFFVTVVGDYVYYGSSVTDSVYCIEAGTGKSQWLFTTDGPVRYPPTFENDKLYFASDDGYAYCVNAADGALIWKYSSTDDQRLIGNNGSLIPMHPIRTGVAVGDGKVYFASSLVSWKQSYLCAVDANTGAEIYKKSGGITPMGAIMASYTKVYLPQGRRFPYVFDRISGSQTGTMGSTGNGGCYALLTSDSTFVHGYGTAANNQYTVREYNAETTDSIATHSNARALLVKDQTTYLLLPTTLGAIDRNNGSSKWSVACDCPHAMIMADNVIFTGGKDIVRAYNGIDGTEIWSKPIKGRAKGLAFANGKLYVSSDNGDIYMFGSAYLEADFDKSGTVDMDDLQIFGEQFLRNTDPTNPKGENLTE